MNDALVLMLNNPYLFSTREWYRSNDELVWQKDFTVADQNDLKSLVIESKFATDWENPQPYEI